MFALAPSFRPLVLSLCLAALVGCGKKAQQQPPAQPEPPREITSDADICSLRGVERGWYIFSNRLLTPMPAEDLARVSQLMDDMRVFHRLWLKADGTYLQYDPSFQRGREVRQTTGKWHYDAPNKQLLLSDAQGLPLDTLKVQSFTADSLVVETGPAEMREHRVYAPITQP